MAIATGRGYGILGLIHRIALRHELSARGDAELLGCFLADGDATAFEALLRRHGPMVLGVCRRILRNEADAEDAFQATFLVLARKAASIAPRSLVGNWLYGVACKVARKAKALGVKRRAKEAEVVRPEAVATARDDWGDLLHEELGQLPEHYRVPIVLCELQGQTIRQAAELLGCPQGTVASRLARGRSLLAERLRQRGLMVTGPALPAMLSPGLTSSSLPPRLVLSTAEAASSCAAGGTIAAGAVSAKVVTLTEGVIAMMLSSKLNATIGVVVLFVLTCGALPFSGRAGDPPPPTRKAEGGRAQAVPAASRSGEEELADLAKAWVERAKQFESMTEKETSFQKAVEAARRFMPSYDPKAVEAFFALERRHRGKPAGLFALNLLMMRACQVGDPSMAVSRGRERALAVLRDHYLAHEDLDVLLANMKGGPILFGAEALLKAAAEKSPHEHVRAAALYYLAELLIHKATCKEQFTKLVAEKPPESSAARASREVTRETFFREVMRETLSRLASFDEKEARKEAERLAKQVLAQYPKVASPHRAAMPDATYWPKRYDVPKPSSATLLAYQQNVTTKKKVAPMPAIPTYAQRAEALLFELANLAVGQTAPPMEGRDADGKPFRLSDSRGKVVVLMFSANWCAPCKRMYPDLRELQKTFAGKPVEVVTVMADREVDTVREAVRKGDITWRAVWDGERGPILSRWNVGGLPTVYVFDQAGVIRARNPDRPLAEVVSGLLKGEPKGR